MSVDEIRSLTDKQVIDLGEGHWFLGTYRISTNWHDLWFRFDEQGLHAITWGVVEDSKSTRLSPRHDLCTSDLDFFLRTTWTDAFVGSSLYLDGELIAREADVPPLLELSQGTHELRIEKRGFRPVVRQFRLDPTDRGDPSIHFTRGDLEALP